MLFVWCLGTPIQNHVYYTEMQQYCICKTEKERQVETGMTELWNLLEIMKWVYSQIIQSEAQHMNF